MAPQWRSGSQESFAAGRAPLCLDGPGQAMPGYRRRGGRLRWRIYFPAQGKPIAAVGCGGSPAVRRFATAEQILVIGYSGRDETIMNRLLLLNLDRVWLVSPGIFSIGEPAWEAVSASHRIDTTATAFARLWQLAELREPAPRNPLKGLYANPYEVALKEGQISIGDEFDVTVFYNPATTRRGEVSRQHTQPLLTIG